VSRHDPAENRRFAPSIPSRGADSNHTQLTEWTWAVGDRGLDHVDEHFRTNVPHVYAAGDVIGFPALTSTSMEQARRAVRHALGLAIRSEISHLLPNGIYTIPEVAMVGETEESLSRQGVDHVVGRAPYLDSGRGRIIGDSDGFLKLLFRREDMKLLGVHVLKKGSGTE
jgi:NAD(P) transhydrogenase